jgi:DNA helicase HerA-like ATPase
MVYETVVGRTKDDFEKIGNQATGYVGKHIVGTGEDAHLTTKVMFDLLRPHMVLITGKRGTGKSYVAGVLAEEMLLLPEEFRENLAVVIVDTMGIFWSMKQPNEQQIPILDDWGLKPKGFDNVKVYVPYNQLESFQKSGIPVDAGMTISPSEFSSDEWLLAFKLSRTEPAGVALQKNVNELIDSRESFTIADMISKIRDDNDVSEEVKSSLENMLTVANQWGVFGKDGVNIDDLVKPSQITVLDVSRLRATEAWSVRNLIVSIISRKIYQRRLIARKEEEIAKISGSTLKNRFPLTWLIIDEAHNFIPSDYETVSSEPLRVISKQGREPGVSLVVITQMPNRIHQDILSQTDVVISHRLTSRDDLQALHSVMQTYLSEDLWKYINTLPRWPGATIVLDDNLEKIFSVNIRPRYSWHAGGTAAIV